jgi:hypothetical protein
LWNFIIVLLTRFSSSFISSQVLAYFPLHILAKLLYVPATELVSHNLLLVAANCGGCHQKMRIDYPTHNNLTQPNSLSQLSQNKSKSKTTAFNRNTSPLLLSLRVLLVLYPCPFFLVTFFVFLRFMIVIYDDCVHSIPSIYPRCKISVYFNIRSGNYI